MSPRWGLLLLAASGTALGTGRAVTDWTVDGGGGRSQSPRFVVEGTVGQPEADSLSSTSSRFVVTGGFWTPAAASGPQPPDIFRDGFEG